MKKTLFIILMIMTAFAVFAEGAKTYKVTTVSGTVKYEKEPGIWKPIKKDMELAANTMVTTGLDSSFVVLDGSKRITIKASQEGQLDKLMNIVAGKKAGLTMGNGVAKTKTAAASTGTEKGAATASERASSAKAGLAFDEDE
jgi:hypothetical protein